MSEAPDPTAEVVAPEPVVEIPAADAPEAAEAPEVADEPVEAAAESSEGQEQPEEARKPKSPVAQLQGRVGHLTKTIHQKDAENEELRRQNEAYQRLLTAQGRAPEEAAPVQADAPLPGTPEFERLVDERAAKKANEARFTADCNAIFDQGVQKHGDAFKEALTNLNVLGLMNEQVVDAALATGAAADVLNFLGSDVDEAARITALPPVRMAVELTKVATKLAEAKPEQPQISRAPAPITPLSGQRTTVEADVYDKRLNSGDKVSPEYAARRAAMGATWARPPKTPWGS